jgi:hypothetical protein
MLDAKKYIKPKFLKVPDFKAGPREFTIVGAKEGQYGLDLLLSTGDTITANATSISNLALAWDFDAHKWVGHRIKGQLKPSPVENEDGTYGEMVELTPIIGERKLIEQPKQVEFGSEDPGQDMPF